MWKISKNCCCNNNNNNNSSSNRVHKNVSVCVSICSNNILPLFVLHYSGWCERAARKTCCVCFETFYFNFFFVVAFCFNFTQPLRGVYIESMQYTLESATAQVKPSLDQRMRSVFKWLYTVPDRKIKPQRKWRRDCNLQKEKKEKNIVPQKINWSKKSKPKKKRKRIYCATTHFLWFETQQKWICSSTSQLSVFVAAWAAKVAPKKKLIYV